MYLIKIKRIAFIFCVFCLIMAVVNHEKTIAITGLALIIGFNLAKLE